MWFKDKFEVVIGVEAAAIMDKAIDGVNKVYQDKLGRPASYQEVVAMARFCLGDESNGVMRIRKDGE